MRHLVTGQRSLSYDQTAQPKHTQDFVAKTIQSRGKELLLNAGTSIDDFDTTTATRGESADQRNIKQ